MLLIEALRAEEVNVGILPMPKQEKSQETYISYLDSNCQIVYALPVTCADSSMVSFVLEAMAQKSLDTLDLKTAITKGTTASTIQSGSTAAEAAIAKTMETLTSGLEKD